MPLALPLLLCLCLCCSSFYEIGESLFQSGSHCVASSNPGKLPAQAVVHVIDTLQRAGYLCVDLPESTHSVAMFIICLCSLICLIVQQLYDSVWLRGRGREILSIEFRISSGISFSVESVIEFAYTAPQSLGQLSLYFGSATVLFSIEGKGVSLHKCHGQQQQQQQITTMTDLHLFLLCFGHAAFCYTISIKATAAVLEKPVKLTAGIPERNLLYLACHLESGQWHQQRQRHRL